MKFEAHDIKEYNFDNTTNSIIGTINERMIEQEDKFIFEKFYPFLKEHFKAEIKKEDLANAVSNYISEEPIFERHIDSGYNGYVCPRCREIVYRNYCPECGKRLEWKHQKDEKSITPW